MTEAEIVCTTEIHVRRLMEEDSSGHDWWHIDRVRRNALKVARDEGANLFIVELSALLHDIADWKFHAGDESAGPRAASEWLAQFNIDSEIVRHICEIIADISFKGAGTRTDMRSIEGQCVQDGDRLDAIGAIGVARAFAFGGHFGRAMYDPEVPPEQHGSFAAYKKNKGPTINHFYEKLLLLKDRMQTATGRRMAAERHQFMQQFLSQFFAEWNGNL